MFLCKMRLLFILSVFAMQGCAMFSFLSDEDSENTTQPAHISEPVDLKVSKLAAKQLELTSQLKAQEQRIAVLERAVRLGIIPAELQQSSQMKLPQQQSTSEQGQWPAEVGVNEPSELSYTDAEREQMQGQQLAVLNVDNDKDGLLSAAQKAYDEGHYGKAIALYSKMDGGKEAHNRYWIALCWFRLKEFETAKNQFEAFIKDHPESPWIPRSKLGLAKSFAELGLKNQSIQTYKTLLADHPNDEASLLAKVELEEMSAL